MQTILNFMKITVLKIDKLWKYLNKCRNDKCLTSSKHCDLGNNEAENVSPRNLVSNNNESA